LAAGSAAKKEGRNRQARSNREVIEKEGDEWLQKIGEGYLFFIKTAPLIRRVGTTRIS
jgi:hypothetical protein